MMRFDMEPSARVASLTHFLCLLYLDLDAITSIFCGFL